LAGKLCNRQFRQRGKHHTTSAGARKIANNESLRVTWANFIIPVRYEEHRACAMNAASQELQQIERRLICPVHILEDHERRRTSLQIVQCRIENATPTAGGIDGVEQYAFGLPGYVVQRGQWTRREECIARAP
jgi:hypothetical protein